MGKMFISNFQSNYRTANKPASKTQVRFGCDAKGPCEQVDNFANLIALNPNLMTPNDTITKEEALELAKKETDNIKSEFNKTHTHRGAAITGKNLLEYAEENGMDYAEAKYWYRLSCELEEEKKLAEELKNCEYVNELANLLSIPDKRTKDDTVKMIIKDVRILKNDYNIPPKEAALLVNALVCFSLENGIPYETVKKMHKSISIGDPDADGKLEKKLQDAVRLRMEKNCKTKEIESINVIKDYTALKKKEIPEDKIVDLIYESIP